MQGKFNKKNIFFLLIIFIINPTNSFNAQSVENIKNSSIPDKSYDLIIWAHSDIQPKTIAERSHYENAVNDIINFTRIDMAILAGDIVQRKESTSDYEWFIRTRSKANIKYWFEIAGNHDARNFSNYFRYIQKTLNYAVFIGNLLIIFLSDEVNSSPTEIADFTFNWWKNLVKKNQDKIIITVTHAYLYQSNLFGNSFYRSNIINSDRFAEILKKYKVNLWLAGHTSVPSFLGYNATRIPELNNTLFINISAIRREFGINSESRILYFKKNSDILLIKMRDHDNKKYIKDKEIKLKLNTTFKYKKLEPQIFLQPGTIFPSSNKYSKYLKKQIIY